MKARPIDQIVYEFMFPKPRQSDPSNFQALLQRNLVVEVRQETHAFYGHLDTPEARYPGLDYTHPTHRIRLSRYPWHRRLFRAFDGLRLTHAEISGLTKWEGSKWAKERFEREQGVQIRDTAADGFPNYVNPDDPYSAQSLAKSRQTDLDDAYDPTAPEGEAEEDGEDNEEEESDGELESVGVSLNERLRARVALRNMSGDNSMPLDEEWENWLKHAIESGDLDVVDQIAQYSGRHSALTADDIFPPRLMAAARAGHWDQIPAFLHDTIRRTIEHAGRRSVGTSAAAGLNVGSTVRYSRSLGGFARAVTVNPPENAALLNILPEVAISGRRHPSRSSRSNNRVQQTARPGA